MTISVFIAHSIPAQLPLGADRLAPHAVAESLKVVRDLQRLVQMHQRDAAAWHHLGMVTWAMWERARHDPPVKELDWTRLAPLADSALRLASDLEPQNAVYYLDAGRYLLASSVQFRRYGPYAAFDAALAKARNSADSITHADAALARSRVAWLRYEQWNCNSASDQVHIHGTIGGRGEASSDVRLGLSDYREAEVFAREAYEAAPGYARAYRQYAALLAARLRWRELAALALDQTKAHPEDGWAWMTLGLSLHRLRNVGAATANYDSALARLDLAERDRLDRIERALGPRGRSIYATLDDSARARAERFYWMSVDPLWSIDGDDPRLEFLSRVAYAELRWTAEELNLRGVDSDQGNAFIRTGDPSTSGAGCRPKRAVKYLWDDTTVHGGPGFSYVTSNGRVDSVLTQLARFRAGPDSVDFVVAALAPNNAILRARGAIGPVREDFWLLNANTVRAIARDSLHPSSPDVHVFVTRVARGNYVYRVEATPSLSQTTRHAPTDIVGARAHSTIIAVPDTGSGFKLSGFGMSDVLLATQAESPAGAIRRWNEIAVKPLAGPADEHSDISLVWESYDLGVDADRARYGVVIGLRREQQALPGSGRIAAAIVGMVAGAIGITRAPDQVEFSFERDVPNASTIADHVTISLGDTPPGDYVLTLSITDRTSGKTTRRSKTVVIAPPARAASLYGR